VYQVRVKTYIDERLGDCFRDFQGLTEAEVRRLHRSICHQKDYKIAEHVAGQCSIVGRTVLGLDISMDDYSPAIHRVMTVLKGKY
jgi:hypothetical protein